MIELRDTINIVETVRRMVYFRVPGHTYERNWLRPQNIVLQILTGDKWARFNLTFVEPTHFGIKQCITGTSEL